MFSSGIPTTTNRRWPGQAAPAYYGEAELAQRNRSGTLPATRPATRYEPKLPKILAPRSSWNGTISAPGALVASSYVRVVFGALDAAGGKGPDGLANPVVWITDHAYRLRRR